MHGSAICALHPDLFAAPRSPLGCCKSWPELRDRLPLEPSGGPSAAIASTSQADPSRDKVSQGCPMRLLPLFACRADSCTAISRSDMPVALPGNGPDPGTENQAESRLFLCPETLAGL